MSMKELQQEIVANMRRWQRIEDASVSSTGQIIEKTHNPLIRLIMEIIQRDSQTHYRVQEFIADSLESKTVTLSHDDLAQVWHKIEDHIELEKQTVKLAEEALAKFGHKKMGVQEFLLHYLLEDENKHNKMLDNLAKIRKDLMP